jgi:RNA polymerase sigma factor (sigma-70 family)
MQIVTFHTKEQVSDFVLWQNYKEGDNDSLSEIMRRYYKSLLQYGTKFTKNKMLIEDILQDLFLALLDRRTFISTPESVKNYLFKAFRNNLNRAINKNNLLIGLKEQEDNLLVELENIEQILMAEDSINELHSKFHQYFELLTKRQKEALHLKYYENLTHDEISVIMDINKQSVSNLLQQAIGILKKNWIVYIILSNLYN